MLKILLISFIILCSLILYSQAPEWTWVQGIGGISNDYGFGIATNNAGNCYVTGTFVDTVNFGNTTLIWQGSSDIFVSKLNENGGWLWTKQAGGTGSDRCYNIALDVFGNCYIVGSFNYSASFGTNSLTSNNSSSDIFVAKLDSNGNWLWVAQAGGDFFDQGHDIAIDNDGNSYITGRYTQEAQFGQHEIECDDVNFFIAKLSYAGEWLWVCDGGCDGYLGDGISAICIDSENNSYITSFYKGNLSIGSYYLENYGDKDIFVAKADSDGNWEWVVHAGSEDDDEGFDIATDNEDYIYVTGDFEEDATFGPYTVNGYYDARVFLAKIDSEGDWQWVEGVGACGSYIGDHGYSLTTDHNNYVYVTGTFSYGITFGSYFLSPVGASDVFVAKSNNSGEWQWAMQAGGSSFDISKAISVGNNGNIFVTGFFRNSMTFGNYIITNHGDSDIFISKISETVSTDNVLGSNISNISNYPNPFNPETTITFNLPEDSNIELDIYNLKGQKVKQLIKGQQSAGQNSVTWNGENESGKSVSSGIYYYQLNIHGKKEAVKKCLLLK